MLDLSNLPPNQKVDQQIFYASAQSWATWVKPRGSAFIHILIFAGGGGGGAGFAGAVGAAGGGGGGGSGGSTNLFILAIDIPDILYVQVGTGGSGALVGGTGTSGNPTYVCLSPAVLPTSTLALANGGGFAGNGAAAAAGTAGTAGASGTIANACLVTLGASYQVSSTTIGNPGQSGSAGGAPPSGAGAALTYPVTGSLTSGGTGGGVYGAANTAGTSAGAQTLTRASTSFPNQVSGSAGPAGGGAGANGPNGIQMLSKLMLFRGGVGGAGAGAGATGTTADIGGAGGKGAYGCGGGGGGGGFTGTTGGKGGAGGDGLCIITSW